MSRSKQARLHRELYAKIPAVEGCLRCGDCCGPVPFSKWEWFRLRDKRLAAIKHKRRLRCPYFCRGGCDIYAHRPLMCQLFGAVEDLRCSRGARPKRLLTAAEGAAIGEAYWRLVGNSMLDIPDASGVR